MTNFKNFFSVVAFSGALTLALSPALPALAQTPAQNLPSGVSQSYNWAGYIATAGNYTSVSGTWNIPQPTNPGSLTADATWVGIGGLRSSDLIQVGTQVLTDTPGQASYQAWYEMLPGNSQKIPITVNAGDSLTASLTQQTTGEWNIYLRDNSNGQNFQTTVAYNSSLSSAEWIEEMPVSNRGFIPLDNFGSVTFSAASAVQNGSPLNLVQAGATAMTMVNSQQQPLATPSAIGPDSASFTVTRASAAVTSTATSVPFSRRSQWRRHGSSPQGWVEQQSGDNSGLRLRIMSGFSLGFRQMNSHSTNGLHIRFER